jgi:alanyl-tRNA synthetase
LADLSIVLSEVMGDPFTELITQRELIQKVIREEEMSFFRTLEQGIKRIDHIITQTKKDGKDIIDGKEVFELYDTYGFPLDLTSLIARENEIGLDEEAFNQELQKQKDRSRAATAIETDDWVTIQADQAVEFVGYDELNTEVSIVKYRKVAQKQKTFFQLVLNKTPFYPEGGGQVGDNGILIGDQGSIAIIDTKKENNLIIHLTEKLPEALEMSYHAEVNRSNRLASAGNHSATHLLHHALRSVLGEHVEQKGSLVNPNYLRFDFSHFSKVTDEELAQIEEKVNHAIKSNIQLNELRNASMETAQRMGAMALFGEKYGDSVRVIQFGDSVELCGGTHVHSTGQIGLFKITSESAVAAGVRRIEAISGNVAEDYYTTKASQFDTVYGLLKNPKDVIKAVEDLISRNQQLQKEVEALTKEKAIQVKHALKQSIEQVNGIDFLAAQVDLDANSIKDILFQLKGEHDRFVGVIGGVEGDKCTLSIIASDSLVNEHSFNAGQLIREAASHIQGGGGGQPFFATAGGKNPSGIKAALEVVRSKMT